MITHYKTDRKQDTPQKNCAEIYAAATICPGIPLSDFLETNRSTPVIDVRSPGEYSAGHLPWAYNIPLFDDDERAQVGKCYKQSGREAALALGLTFADVKILHLLDQAQTISQKHSTTNLKIYCWRGGERSAAITCLFREHGFSVQRLAGGYKSFRQFVLESMDSPYILHILGGKTGSGKTAVLQELEKTGEQVIDLEHLARHKGSAFGGIIDTPQPTCEHFENRLAMRLWAYDKTKPIWVEDESQKLGKVRLPKAFFERMQSAEATLLETNVNLRLERVIAEYASLGTERIREGLERIQQRLGGVGFQTAIAFLDKGDLPALASLLLEYYDRGYTHQARQRAYCQHIYMTTPEDCAKKITTPR